MKKLIPKAQFGTRLVRKALKWVTDHTAPTREQTLFDVQNQRRIARQKPRELRDLQQDLKDLGYYHKSVDNLMGSGTRSAIQQAQADGYKIDMNNFTISSKKKLQKKQPKKYESIQKSDMKEFGKWLYEKGLDTTPIGNVFTTGIHWLLNQLPLQVGRGDMPFMDYDSHKVGSPGLSKGTKLQALGLYFYLGGANSRTKNNERKRDITVSSNAKYEWQKINGGKDVNNKDQSLIEKTRNSGQFTLGQYTVVEGADNKYHIKDTYNFNPESEAETRRRASKKDASSYDKIRLMSQSGVNNDLVINSSVPEATILEYYNRFKAEQK